MNSEWVKAGEVFTAARHLLLRNARAERRKYAYPETTCMDNQVAKVECLSIDN